MQNGAGDDQFVLSPGREGIQEPLMAYRWRFPPRSPPGSLLEHGSRSIQQVYGLDAAADNGLEEAIGSQARTAPNIQQAYFRGRNRVAAKPIPGQQLKLPGKAFPHVPVLPVVDLGFKIVKQDVYRPMKFFGTAADAVSIHDPAHCGMSLQNRLGAGGHGSNFKLYCSM